MSVQNHIHLDLTTVPHDADGAPLKRWSVISFEQQPSQKIQMRVTRSLTGHTYVSIVTDSSDEPVVHHDYSLVLRCTLDDYYYMKAMLGKEAEFIKNDHPDTGSDHSGDIVSVFVSSVSGTPLDNMLRYWNVNVSLADLTQPA